MMSQHIKLLIYSKSFMPLGFKKKTLFHYQSLHKLRKKIAQQSARNQFLEATVILLLDSIEFVW